MTDLRETLRRELPSKLGLRVTVDNDTPLFSSGLLDSMSVLELVMLVEQHIGKPIAPEDITLEHFDSVELIAQFVARLDGAGASS